MKSQLVLPHETNEIGEQFNETKSGCDYLARLSQAVTIWGDRVRLRDRARFRDQIRLRDRVRLRLLSSNCLKLLENVKKLNFKMNSRGIANVIYL